jgi:hypothetical protein
MQLELNSKTILLRKLIPTFGFYATGITTIFLLEKISPAGPCSPGMGMLALLIFLPVCLGLLIKNIYLSVRKDISIWPIAAAHLVAIGLFFLSSYV